MKHFLELNIPTALTILSFTATSLPIVQFLAALLSIIISIKHIYKWYKQWRAKRNG